MTKKISGVYAIFSPSGKVYVGSSVDIKQRFRKYRKLDCSYQPKLSRSLKKYGPNAHEFKILIECDSYYLYVLEYYYGKYVYDTLGINGLNCVLPKIGEVRRIISNETRCRMSLASKNRFHTAESRLKISIANAGKKRTTEQRMKTSNSRKKLILNTETGVYYLGVKEASESVPMNKFTLTGMLNGIDNNRTPLMYA